MKKLIVVSLTLILTLVVSVVGTPMNPGVDAVSAASPVWVPDKTTTQPAPTSTTTPAKATVSVPAGEGTYIVVDGDAMWKIAAKFKMTLSNLIALNPQIKDPNVINIGQKIIVKDGVTTSVVNNGKVKIYEGIGYKTAFRNGPGADSEKVPVYSFNIAMARVTFDAQGKILNAYIDGYEVATPNYDGASMPHFSGWPDIPGYNVSNHDTGLVTGKSVNTKESAAAEVNGWLTKRQRGDSYHMNPANEWYKQMDFFQKFFVGKTVDELEAWFAKYTTTAGRPIKANTTNATDLAKFNKLTAAEKADLADVVSGATMSIRDAHGDFLGAVSDAYKNRVEVEIPVK